MQTLLQFHGSTLFPTLNMIRLSISSAFFLVFPLFVSPLVAKDRSPNLIVILTDDQGYADVGFNGCKDIPTPNIDRIANEGARCTNGYVTYAVCGPSRAGLITGRYQDRFGACRNPTIDPTVPNNGVPRSEKMISEILQTVGYKSMAVGKWHLGTYPGLRPLERGFDEFYGFLSGGHDYFPENLTLEDLSEVTEPWAWYRTKLLRNDRRVETKEYLTDELSQAGVDFIDRNHEQPFFLYMAYNAPHTPMQASEKYLARFSNIEDVRRRTYAAMVSSVDDGVGMILDKLAEHQLDEDTIVFFLSDNGGATNNSSINRPLRGNKGDPFEGGVRVPFAVRWSGTIPAGVNYHKPVSSLDIAATIASHSQASVSQEKPLDGVDLVPYLTGKNQSYPHSVLYWRWYDSKRYAIRSGDDKLIIRNSKKDLKKFDKVALYDLVEDVSEKNNLARSRPHDVSEAESELETWREQLVPPLAPGLGSWIPEKK